MKALAGKRGQRGAALILFVAGMIVIIGMAGLALDLGHAYLNKTRLQNALDAAALSGAKVLDTTHDTDQAEAAARATFEMQLSEELREAGLAPVVQFSDTLVPFVPGGIDPKFVRVRVATFPMTVWFARVLPGIGTTQTIGGSAVAGPSPPIGTEPGTEVCNIAPMVACGTNDTDCSDGSCYGYEVNAEKETVLKTGKNNDWEVGPGNFQLITLDNCGPGGDCVFENMAGAYGGCVELGGTVTTEPGKTVGPAAHGLNTRFGYYQGPATYEKYPPDIFTRYPGHGADEFWWDDYQQAVAESKGDPANFDESGGVPERRVVVMPFGDCTGTTNGRGTVPVLGLACFFLTRPAGHTGKQEIYGQFIGDCKADGPIAEDPEPNPGGAVLYKIQLYKDPDSGDS